MNTLEAVIYNKPDITYLRCWGYYFSYGEWLSIIGLILTASLYFLSPYLLCIYLYKIKAYRDHFIVLVLTLIFWSIIL